MSGERDSRNNNSHGNPAGAVQNAPPLLFCAAGDPCITAQLRPQRQTAVSGLPHLSIYTVKPYIFSARKPETAPLPFLCGPHPGSGHAVSPA